MSDHSSIRYKGHIGTKNYKKLQRNVKTIKRNLSVEVVLDDLISNEVLSIEDGVFIRDKRVNHAMADSLIEKLIFVGKDGFEIFERVLRDNGYGYMIDQDQESKMSPVESSESGNISRTTSSTHSQHHVHFSDQLPTQESSNHSQPSSKSTVKLSGTSILTKPCHLPVQSSYPEDRPTVTISGNLNDVDSPGKDDDDNQYCEETEYDDCSVGPKSKNIILGEPIPYTGDPNTFRYWFPVVHIDGRLREFPGCHPDVDEKKIKHIVSEQKDNEGDYVIWYSGKRGLLIITVIHRSSPKGRYHYKVKCRQSDSEVSYRFSSQHEAKSVVELLDYARAEGLPPPVQKKADG